MLTSDLFLERYFADLDDFNGVLRFLRFFFFSEVVGRVFSYKKKVKKMLQKIAFKFSKYT